MATHTFVNMVETPIEVVWSKATNLRGLERFFGGNITFLNEDGLQPGVEFQLKTKGLIKEVFTRGYIVEEVHRPYKLVVKWQGSEMLTSVAIEWRFLFWQGFDSTLVQLEVEEKTQGLPQLEIPVLKVILQKRELKKQFKKLVQHIES